MKKYLIPIVSSLGIIIFGTLISSILYYFNLTSDKVNMILLYLISISTLFTGALLLSKNGNQKGIITGALYFLFWFIIMFFISLIFFKESFSTNRLIYYLIVLVFSLLGGIIGKNTKKETV